MAPTPLRHLPSSMQARSLAATMALPRRAKRLLAGRPIVVDGQTLDLDSQLLLRLNRWSAHPLTENDPVAARAHMEVTTKVVAGPPITEVSTRDLTIPARAGSQRARLYTPPGFQEPGGLLLYVHGGAFIGGSIDSHDATTRFLALHSGARVLSVEYRLAPENPFPAGFEDVLDAYDYVIAEAAALGADPARIAVGGDSAGGNLSAVIAQEAVRLGGPAPAFQLLIYPAVDFTKRHPSRDTFAAGFLLTDEDTIRAERFYFAGGGDKADPTASPLRAKDLSGLPPAYVVTAGFDPLRDEGEAYAHAMREAGVTVALRREEDLLHGFVNMLGAGARCRQATLDAAHALRAGLRVQKRMAN